MSEEHEGVATPTEETRPKTFDEAFRHTFPDLSEQGQL